jgi:hypothetical protein
MNTDRNTIRLLGAAFLIVFVASMLSGALLDSAVGTGSMSDILVNVANNLTLMRISILVELVTSVGIVALAALLYIVLHEQHRVIALVALGWWLAEAITLGVSKIGAFALIPLSLEYVAAGAPDSSPTGPIGYFQTLGDFFYYGFDRQGWAIHMLFFCLGGILWYYLFYRSKYIPRVLSGWGLVAVSLVLINILLVLFDRSFDLQMIMLAPYLVFEALIGPWLMVKGVRDASEIGSHALLPS